MKNTSFRSSKSCMNCRILPRLQSQSQWCASYEQIRFRYGLARHLMQCSAWCYVQQIVSTGRSYNCNKLPYSDVLTWTRLHYDLIRWWAWADYLMLFFWNLRLWPHSICSVDIRAIASGCKRHQHEICNVLHIRASCSLGNPRHLMTMPVQTQG